MIVISHITLQFILNYVANRIVRQVSTVDDLSSMLRWYTKIWSTKSVLAFVLPFCLLMTLYGDVIASNIIHQFPAFGLTLATVLDGLLEGTVIYYFVWAIFMVVNLKEYQYEMNIFSPADSEIISNISEVSTKGIYIVALEFAVMSLIITSSLYNELFRVTINLPILVFGWTLILASFLLTRSTLSSIINRAKWKTLNRIRDKINAIEATGDLSDKDTAERLLCLADIHKQIMASNTKTLTGNQ